MNNRYISIEECCNLENSICEKIENDKDDTNDIQDERLKYIDFPFTDDTYIYKDELNRMNVSNLKKIMKFYDIPINRRRKHEIINTLIEFEMDELNYPIVMQRNRYWQYIYELMNNNKMLEYIQNF